MGKKMKLVLKYTADGSYVVTRVVNTMRWTPGQYLSKAEAEKAMATAYVEVTVV